MSAFWASKKIRAVARAADALSDITMRGFLRSAPDSMPGKRAASTGWKAVDKGLASVVNRAPTHEPYPFHNTGVKV